MTEGTSRFQYWTGEKVKQGDVVRTGNGKFGVVRKVIVSGSVDSESYCCPDGGILIEENWEGVSSFLVMVPPDGRQWEDLELIRRGGLGSSRDI